MVLNMNIEIDYNTRKFRNFLVALLLILRGRGEGIALYLAFCMREESPFTHLRFTFAEGSMKSG